MRAIQFTEKLTVIDDAAVPTMPPGEALIRTRLAGICNTDIEIIRGYFGFKGILGHEFVGEVAACDTDSQLIGKRVVGEINAYCRECHTCRRGDPTHCPNRSTLGIYKRDGVMAEMFTLPTHLLYPLSDTLSDEKAVFAEPLAAACEVLEQVHIQPEERVVVIGDGKLGLLIAQVLRLTGCDLTVIGRHKSKLDRIAHLGVDGLTDPEKVLPGVDYVVEATGNPDGFALARRLVRPRGTIICKSTYHGKLDIDMSMIVVDEIRLIGSRCGPFAPALRLMEQGLVDVECLIDDRFPLADGLKAFDRATEPGVMKVLLEP